MEFKLYREEKEKAIEDTIENAKKQIEEKGYEQNLRERGFNNITKMVFAFKGKKCKMEVVQKQDVKKEKISKKHEKNLLQNCKKHRKILER